MFRPIDIRCWSLVLLLLTGGPVSCAGDGASRGDPASEPRTGTPPTLGEPYGLENVLEVTPGVISGGEPSGDAGYAALRELGIRSLISTDAVAPDLERARDAGIRVVHLPIGYDGISAGRRLELAAAMRDLPKPIYIHCHHGKHRGPAAACVGAVGAGLISPEDGLAFMERAGTSRSYPGLWRDAGGATRLGDADLDGIAERLPESDVPDGTPSAMALIDRAHERLWLVADNGWEVPEEHPDLAPASDAGLIRDLLRSLEDSPEVRAYGADYRERLEAAAEYAGELERSLITPGADSGDLQLSLDALLDSCIACHSAYRD